MNLPQHLLHRVVSFLLKARISTKPDCPSPCSTGKHDFMDGVDESCLALVRRDTDGLSIKYYMNHPREDDVTAWDLYEYANEQFWHGWNIHSFDGRSPANVKKKKGQEVAICSSSKFIKGKVERNSVFWPWKDNNCGLAAFLTLMRHAFRPKHVLYDCSTGWSEFGNALRGLDMHLDSGTNYMLLAMPAYKYFSEHVYRCQSKAVGTHTAMYNIIADAIELMTFGEDSLRSLFMCRVHKRNASTRDENGVLVWEPWEMGRPLPLIIGHGLDFSPGWDLIENAAYFLKRCHTLPTFAYIEVPKTSTGGFTPEFDFKYHWEFVVPHGTGAVM